MLDLQEAHQKKGVDLANDQVTSSPNFSFGSINFTQALGSLTAHVDGSVGDIPGVEWDDTREVEEAGNVARQVEDSGMEHGLEMVEVQR